MKYFLRLKSLHFSEIKVDCIRVSTTPVKSVIDDHIQRLFDALLNSLRRAVTSDVNTIDTFLTSATETLSERPQTVEEIGIANAKHTELSKTKKEVSVALLLPLCYSTLHICHDMFILIKNIFRK